MEIQDFAGRWPGSTKFQASNMQGTVQEFRDGEYRIRLDDAANADFWMELTLVTRHQTQQTFNQEDK